MSDFLVEQDDAVLRITINHPERGNAMTDDMAAELTRIIVAAAKTASVMVLRGAGEDFCVGRARGPGGAPPPQDALGRRDISEVIFNCYGAFRRAPIPIIVEPPKHRMRSTPALDASRSPGVGRKPRSSIVT